MTYSILALDPTTGQAGIAVASGSIAVGSRVPWAQHGVGVVATQAYTNPSLGPLILKYISEGMEATLALRRALSIDPSPAHRQVAVIDYRGDIAVHDGDWVPTWHGYIIHSREVAVCIANLVVGPEVCQEAMRAFEHEAGSLAYRLLRALKAGHDAGGDKRGDRSAALIVVGQTPYSPYYDRIVDIRVDLAEDPIKVLETIFNAIKKEE